MTEECEGDGRAGEVSGTVGNFETCQAEAETTIGQDIYPLLCWM